VTAPTGRAVPFYCPYCGEEDIEPDGDEPGRFACNSCTRHFLLRFVGQRFVGQRFVGQGVRPVQES